MVVGSETRSGPDRTIDIEHQTAVSANEVMVIVAHAVFVAGRRASWLNAPNQVLIDQHCKRVVHRLARDRADHCAHVVGQVVGGGMRTCCQGAHHSHSLSGDLNAVLAQQLIDITGHVVDHVTLKWIRSSIGQCLDLGVHFRKVRVGHTTFAV